VNKQQALFIHGGNVKEKLRGMYPEGDVTYKATDHTIVERFSAKPEANKTKPRKRHVIPDAGRDDTVAAMEATKKNSLP